MQIFELLKNNKGTVSSALGKQLAQQVLEGDLSILEEAIELSSYNTKNKKEKNIRSGAAKIIEIVAEKKPELIAPGLNRLLPALAVDEPQTRWMIIRTIGFCASLNPKVAKQAIDKARNYISKKEGLCIASSADLFLGDYGAISEKHAKEIFPILEKSLSTVIKNEEDWIMESFLKIFELLSEDEQEIIRGFARLYVNAEKKSTQKRANKILRLEKQNKT